MWTVAKDTDGDLNIFWKFHLFSVLPDLLRTTAMFDNLLNSQIKFVVLLTVNHTILIMLTQRI